VTDPTRGALLDAAQREVADLIAAPRSPSPTALRDDPFIGCWAGRDGLADSTAWVRRTRQQDAPGDVSPPRLASSPSGSAVMPMTPCMWFIPLRFMHLRMVDLASR